MDMSKRAALFSQQGYSYDTSVAINKGHLMSRGTLDKQETDVMYPIDELTGLPSTDLGRLANPMLSKTEKEKVMSRLSSTGKGAYLPSNLTDDEIYSLIPPRYFTFDQVDIEAWRDYLGKEVLPNMKDAVIEEEEDKVQDVEPSNED